DAEPRDGRAVIAPRCFVAADREARRVEPVEPQERLAYPVGALQECHVDGHVLGARAPARLEQQLPPNGGPAPRRPTAISQQQARSSPSADTRTPGCGPRKRGPPLT